MNALPADRVAGLPAALPLAVAAMVTLLLLLALLRWAPRLGLLDVPNARSSHRRARPRGGGAAIVLGVLAGVATLAAMGHELEQRIWVVLGAALVLAAMGLWDDLASLAAASRLAVQCAAAIAVVAILGGLEHLPLPPPANVALPPLAGALLAALWLVAVTNFFNFMDGIDGLAAGQALLTILALAAVASRVTPLAGLLAATLLVFLVFNWAPARIFLGDVGSGFLGFLLAAWPWLGPTDLRERHLFLIALSLSLFLLDPLWTLFARWRLGARFGESHREHLYQRLAGGRMGHPATAAALLAGGALLAGLAIWSDGESARSWFGTGVAMLLFLVELRLAFRAGNRVADGS
ncbi:MAG: glycosyl transferase [Thermoanaerobaculia bacterium]